MKKPALYVLLAIAGVFIGCILQNKTGPDERKLMNYQAFSKLYGYIKYFHPSDEASKIDWDKFAVYGMKKVESASGDKELKDVLNEIFLPMAPSLVLHEDTDYSYDKSLIIPKDTTNLKIVAWQHKGVYLGSKFGGYKSVRINRAEKNESLFGTITQSIEAKNYLGKKIKLKGAVKTRVPGAGNQAQLWLRVDLKDKKQGFFDNMKDRPIVTDDWKEFEITGDVAGDAESIYFGCFLKGKGKVWVDELRLYSREDNGEWKEIEIPNADFETGDVGSFPEPWGERYGDYNMTLTSAEKYKGNMSALIEYTGDDNLTGKLFDKLPMPGETITKKISENLYCTFPVALYSDNSGTIPKADGNLFEALNTEVNKGAGSEFDANDLYVRLADVAIAWNVFQHFYPYFDAVNVNWEPVLGGYLEKAIAAKDDVEFLLIVKEFVAELKDGHGGISWAKNKNNSYAPILLDYVESKVVVTRVLDESIKDIIPGDIIMRIDGVEIDSVIRNISKHVSSATPQWKMYKVTHYELTRGENGSEIKLTTENKNAGAKDVILKRSYTVSQISEKGWYDEKRPKEIEEISSGIYYVDLDRASMDAINRSMDKLSKAKGVIFDLRGYPNGNEEIICHLIDSPVQSARWNIPMTIYPDRENPVGYDTSGRWKLEPLAPRLKGKIVYLTNGRAISYAESCMGIIEAYKLAEIVGEPTAGTNGNVNTINLPGGYSVNWTGMKVLKNDGSQHHGIGILPTITVHKTIKGISEGRDEFLEKALEVIRGK